MRIETSDIGSFQQGDWVQVVTAEKVYYCRIWSSNRNIIIKSIYRPLSIHEKALKLNESAFGFPCVIRPWQAKVPVATSVRLNTTDNISAYVLFY